MRKKSQISKRALAILLVVVMLFTTLQPGAIFSAGAEVVTVTLTEGEIVASNYELSDAEKQILNSGYLVGNIITCGVPTAADELISVDTESKKVTAASYETVGYEWTPVSATVVVGEEVKETVTLTKVEGTYTEGTYTYDGNAFSIKVNYELKVTVDEATQKALLSAPANLKQGIVNLDAVYAADANLGTLVLAMDSLKQLADGMKFTLGSMSGTAQLGTEAAAAVNALKAQLDTNGALDLSASASAYASADSKVAYLVTEGANAKAQLNSTYDYVKAIRNDVLWTNTIVMAYLQIEDPTTYNMIQVLLGEMDKWLTAMEPVVADEWAATKVATVRSDVSAVGYTALDLMVAALGETKGDTVTDIKNPLLAATTTVQYNMSMFDVKVKVVLKVVDDEVGSATLVEYGTKSAVVTLADGATKAEIEAAVAESGVVDAALKDWTGAYVADKFDVTYTELPGNLEEDVEYVITYAPKSYNVTLKYDDDSVTAYPYGYKMVLAKSAEEGKVFDYTVNGTYYAEGSVYVVTGDATIDRAEGKPYVGSNLNEVVSNRYLEDGSKADSILTSGALLIGNESVNVRYPDNDNGLVKLEDAILTVGTYPASYNGLEWIPYSYAVVTGTDKVVHEFNGASVVTIAETNYDRVEVTYRLALTNIEDADVLEVLNLAAILDAEATAQKAALDRISADGYLSNMGQLDRTKLGALSGVIDYTPLTAVGADGNVVDEAAEAAMKAYFKTVVNDMITNCVDTDGQLKIYKMLSTYRDANNGGLGYYYQNSDAIKNQINLVSDALSAMLADDDKVLALQSLVNAAGYPEYAEKISGLETAMAEVKADLTAPNAAINLESANFNKLIDALEMEGTVEEYKELPGALYLESKPISVNADTKTTVSVSIQIGNTTVDISTVTYDDEYVLTAEDVNAIIAAIDAKVAEMNANDAFYTTDYDKAVLEALVGQSAENIESSYSFTWAPKEFTVTVEGIADQVITIDNLTIQLPASADAAVRYEYVIGGNTYQSGKYTFTENEVTALFVDGKYKVTRNEISVKQENLTNLVDKLNDSVGGNTIVFALTKDAKGEFSIVMRVDAANVGALQSAVMEMVMGFVNSGYSYIGLDDNSVLYMDETNTLKVSLQAVVDAVMNSGIGSDTLIAVMDANGKINNMAIPGTVVSFKPLTPVGGELMTTTMQLGNTKDDAYNVPFYVTLGSAPAELVQARNLLAGQLAAYMDIVCDDDNATLTLNMPQKAYEAYLAVLLATDNVDITDLNAVNGEIAVGFVKDFVDPLFTDSDITTSTLTNTLVKFGYNVDLTKYEAVYDLVRDFYGTCEFTYDETSGTASGNLDVSDIIARYAGDLGNMIVEYETGIDLNLQIGLTNLGNDYEALYFDIGADGVTNKFGLTKDIAAQLDDIAGTAMVVLLNDVEGNLVLDTTTVLNLNGFTVKGNVTGNGSVAIVDTNVNEGSCGAVTGNVSGKVTIVGGKYDADVSAFVKAGYVQGADGVVANEFYNIVKDADGNITVEVNAGVLTTDSMPDVKALAVDVVADLLFNGYTMNKLYVEGNMVYDITIEDLVGIYADDNRVDVAVNEIVTMADSAQLAAIMNLILDDVTDFAALQTAVENGDPILSYAISTGAWKVELDRVADGDYLTANLASGNEKDRTLNVVVTGDDADKEALAALLGELAATTKVDAEVSGAQGFDSADDKNFVLDWSASANIAVDLTANPDYAIVLSIAIADGIGASANADLIAGIKAYYQKGTLADLEKAFNALTISQVLTALKNLEKNDDFSAMVANLGLQSVVADKLEKLVALETIYDSIAKIAAAVVREIDISGGNRTMESFLKDGAYGADKSNVAREYNVDLFRGYSLTLDLAVTEASVSVKLFADEVAVPEFVDGTGTPEVGLHDKIVGSYVDTDKKLIYIDADPNGITVAELSSALKFYAINADNIAIEIENKSGLVYNGAKLVATASNEETDVTDVVEYTIIVLGDVNGNGRVEAGDASVVSQRLVGLKELNWIEELAADINGNDRVDVGDASRIASKVVDWVNYKTADKYAK